MLSLRSLKAIDKYIIVLFLFTISVQGADITFRIGDNDNDGVILVHIDDIRIKTDPYGSIFYTGVEQIQELGETGEPKIPWKVFDILLPPDTDLKSVACIVSRCTFKPMGNYTLPPILPKATCDKKRGTYLIHWPKNRNIVDGLDVEIYSKNAFWPENIARVVHVGKLRNYKMAKVAVALLRYNPVTKELESLENSELSIHFNRSKNDVSNIFDKSDYIGYSRVKSAALNSNQYLNQYSSTHYNSDVTAQGYVILTTEAIKNSLQQLDNFINHKQSRGFTVEVVTDWGGSSGDEASENIRKWLQDNYTEKNIQYVLLIGNPDPEDGDVPMKFCYEQPSYSDEAPTDMYYSNLSGDWDIDNDGFYGTESDIQPGGVDLYWEVMVGRIPQYDLDSSVVTDVILARTIDYENADDKTWRWNALLPWVPMDGSTPNYHCPEQLIFYFLDRYEIGYHRIYASDYGLNPPPEDYPNSEETTTEVWKNGKFGFVFWGAHGWSSGCEDVMSSESARTLNDDYPSNTWQYSCSTGYPEEPDNLAYELLKSCCVSTSGATRSGWYSIGQTDYSNSTSEPGMGYQYHKRVVVVGTSIGKAWHDTRAQMVPGMWDNFILHNIYGDPSIGIYDTASSDIVNHGNTQSLNPCLKYYNSVLHYQVPDFGKNRQAHVTISLYSITGRLIKSVVNILKWPGMYSVNFTDRNTIRLSSGMYLCALQIENSRNVIRILYR